MRTVVLFCLVLGLVTAPLAVAVADDTEALRRELEKMRQQFENVQQEYQKAIQSLSERLQRLEARPLTTSARPVVAQIPPPSGQTPVSQPTLQELARPREPFALAQRSGAGQLLFDMGVAGDFVGNLVRSSADDANVGTFAGREDRFFPREIELSLFGQIDPYARGEVRIETGEEFEAGVRENHIGLAEAHLTLLTLPYGLQLKMGQVRNRFGLLNHLHRDGLPQPDVPNVHVRFVGEEGLVEKGAELTWIAPLPFYLEALVGLFNGDNETAFGRESLRNPLVTGRLRSFFDLDESSAIQLGSSVASGETAERRRSTLLGADVKYKLTPEGWIRPLLTVAAEAMYSNRRVVIGSDLDGDGTDDVFQTRTRNRFGWYTYVELQPMRRWAGGIRYDKTHFPVEPGREWAVEPYVAFMPSEFLRFRLAYKHTERSSQVSGPSALNELLFQGTFVLGAHIPHPF
jgi:hypothetical protein